MQTRSPKPTKDKQQLSQKPAGKPKPTTSQEFYQLAKTSGQQWQRKGKQ
jgi:hypothetical protein